MNKSLAKRQAFFRELPLHLMLIPSLVLVAIYSYGAMAGTAIAFQRFNPAHGLFGSEWIGWANFQTLFSLPNFWPVIRNTVIIAVSKMVLLIVVPVIFALLLNEVRNRKFKSSVQTLVYLPHFISWIILAGIFRELLSPSSGAIGILLSGIGIDPPFFLGDRFWFPITMVVTDVWKGFGFASIIYLAALTSIDPVLYESAMIDGANRWKQTLHITLPGITPVIILLSVLSMANVLNGGFDQIYNLYSPVVMETGDILDTFIFRLGIEQAQFALSTAAGLFRSAVSLVFVVLSYFLAGKAAGYKIF
ncbi:MAG: ABC transporter permease subunit [Oscillospiraceae bacterium]|nr:ABC transporter permease subunit [Oscillospiraceae bacterium]